MGFRRITFWPDRPDVLSQWSVRLEGDAAALPVLLSNGNLTQAGQLPGSRHYTLWEVRGMRDYCTAATMYCWAKTQTLAAVVDAFSCDDAMASLLCRRVLCRVTLLF
jgi:hypothetical protein